MSLNTWKELLESVSTNSEILHSINSQHTWACVYIDFAVDTHTGIVENILRIRSIRARILHDIEKAYSEAIAHIAGHDTSLQLYLPCPTTATNLAFHTLSSLGHHGKIAIGYDTGILLDSYKSMENLHAETLARFANHHEIAMTENCKQHITIPDGVGCFPSSNPRSKQVGFPFWILKDYR